MRYSSNRYITFNLSIKKSFLFSPQELINENRLLRTLQKRQGNALTKYENSASELPQLIKSHAEELRVWQTKCRNLSLQNREFNKKIQQKDKIINDLTDRLKHLTMLNAEKYTNYLNQLFIKLWILIIQNFLLFKKFGGTGSTSVKGGVVRAKTNGKRRRNKNAHPT